jgi:hypothetical protein
LKDQFKLLLRGELLFVRVVCHPSKDEYARIAAVGDEALGQSVREYAEAQSAAMRGDGRNEWPKLPDPRQLIAGRLYRATVEILSNSQAETYKQELDKRAAHRKYVTILNLVAMLDRKLVLTAEQREKLVVSLTDQWNESWSQSLEILTLGDQYFPILPDNYVLPILNDFQRSVWRETPKNPSVVFGWLGGAGLLRGMLIDDAVWD